jgi:uncharacterized membrane protein required for colicin V production
MPNKNFLHISHTKEHFLFPAFKSKNFLRSEFKFQFELRRNKEFQANGIGKKQKQKAQKIL